MADAVIPNALLLEAIAVFRAGDRRDDTAAAIATFEFLRLVETQAITTAEAQDFLARKDVVGAYIEQTRSAAAARAETAKAQLSTTHEALLAAIRADTRQTLSVQQQMHSDVQRLNTAAERLEHASLQSVADARALSGMISTVMRNTSTRSAFAIGLAVGVLAGIPVNLGTSAVYERWFSVEAWNGRKPEYGASAVPAAPLPELVQPWPPLPAENPAENPNDIMSWFRRNDSFTFRPAKSPAALAPGVRAQPGTGRLLRHQR